MTDGDSVPKASNLPLRVDRTIKSKRSGSQSYPFAGTRFRLLPSNHSKDVRQIRGAMRMTPT